MTSPRICWIDVVGRSGIQLLAGASGWGSFSLAANWRHCGTSVVQWQSQPLSSSMGKANLMCWLRGWAHRRTGGASCWVGPGLLGMWGVFNVDRLLSGIWKDGVGVWLLSSQGYTVQMGYVKFAWWTDVLGVSVCLEGATWSVKGRRGCRTEDICCRACCFSGATQKMLACTLGVNGGVIVSSPADISFLTCIHMCLLVVLSWRRQRWHWVSRELAFLFFCLVLKGLDEAHSS